MYLPLYAQPRIGVDSFPTALTEHSNSNLTMVQEVTSLMLDGKRIGGKLFIPQLVQQLSQPSDKMHAARWSIVALAIRMNTGVTSVTRPWHVRINSMHCTLLLAMRRFVMFTNGKMNGMSGHRLLIPLDGLPGAASYCC